MFALCIFNFANAQWIVQTSGTTNNLNSTMLYGGFGWIVGNNGIILKTFDSGATWLKLTQITTKNINKLSFQSVSEVYAVGDSGTFVDVSNSIVWPGGSFTNNLNSIYTCMSYNNFAVGDSGAIFKREFSGPNSYTVTQTSGTLNNLKGSSII